jgi:hypothetical protein
VKAENIKDEVCPMCGENKFIDTVKNNDDTLTYKKRRAFRCGLKIHIFLDDSISQSHCPFDPAQEEEAKKVSKAITEAKSLLSGVDNLPGKVKEELHIVMLCNVPYEIATMVALLQNKANLK